jgi:hypothetical protein
MSTDGVGQKGEQVASAEPQFNHKEHGHAALLKLFFDGA